MLYSTVTQGQSKFICPARQPDGTSCGAEWSYPEVRRFALLTVEEMEHFEKELARIVAAKFKAVSILIMCLYRKGP